MVEREGEQRQGEVEKNKRRKLDARVVVLLVDHVNLRPGGELHIVVRALQACILY